MMFGVTFILFNLFSNVYSYRVLVVGASSLHSYHVIETSVVKHLLNDGHEVTYLSENIIENSTSKLKQEHFKLDYLETEVSESHRSYELLKNLKVNEFLKKPENNFDVVISTWLHNNIIAGIAAMYQCPMIWLVSNDLTDTTSPASCRHSAYLHLYQKKCIFPNVFHTLRGISCLLPLKDPEEFSYKVLFEPIAKSRGVSLSNYDDLIYNTSVMYLTQPSLSYNLAVPPYVKYIGGIHVEDESTDITQDLQNILNNQQYGVIYLNMGYDTKHIFSKSDINILLNVFKQLKETVFWQYEEELSDLPKNVVVQKSFPHFGILGHRNTRVLLTDLSVTSINEAVYYAVPVLSIVTDRCADTPTNRNITNIVYLDDQLELNLNNALEQILADESFSFNAQDVSDVYHDRILPPSEEFKGWVNYVCKKGVKHLHCETLPMYEVYALDVIGLFIYVILLVFVSFWCFRHRGIVKNWFRRG